MQNDLQQIIWYLVLSYLVISDYVKNNSRHDNVVKKKLIWKFAFGVFLLLDATIGFKMRKFLKSCLNNALYGANTKVVIRSFGESNGVAEQEK